ncbi:MAG: NAD(P)-dependent oxidoreductase [Bacteroidia bacterium]
MTFAYAPWTSTRENAGYFSYEKLKKSKPGMLFINISRGELSPSTTLLRLLEEGHPGGVAIDVYEQESPAALLREGKKTDNPEVLATVAISNTHAAFARPIMPLTARKVDRKASRECGTAGEVP